MLNRIRDNHRIDVDSKYWETILEIENSLEITEDEDIYMPDLDELVKSIDKIVDTLPRQCRQIFIMAKRQGMKYREIADKLNLSPKTVENQMGIAFRKIREGLKKE